MFQSDIFKFLIGLIIALPFVDCHAFTPQSGDLFFQDLQRGEICEAIAKVTEQPHRLKISHVALAIDEHRVIEAIDKCVSIISIEQFLTRNGQVKHPKVIVGRLLPQYRYLIPNAVCKVIKWKGLPYNDSFTSKNRYKSFYCSQLVCDAFTEANNGKPLFELKPMTFKKNGATLTEWVNYFEAIKKPIPENELGSNPGMLSHSPKIKIIYQY